MPFQVAWVMTRSFAKLDVSKWTKDLVDRASSIDVAWKINAFMIDDAAAEVDPIRKHFAVLSFSLSGVSIGHGYETLSRDVITLKFGGRCLNVLGELPIAYGEVWILDVMEEFIQDFVDQISFMQYFKACWVPEIAEHWFDRYADEIDFFQTVKEDYIASSSWHRASQIPENAVIFDDKDRLFAKVISQNDPSQTHILWNPVSFQSFRSIILSLWQKPMDDSAALDQSLAWSNHMLDQIQRSVELDNSNGVSNIVNTLPLKWTAIKVEHLLPIQLLS
ncbi:hypothetical protein MKX03_036466 [Papaver bracteatum]|nr:hypothetical protein MKX03_036466 [Papaver bracteatum]